MAGGLNTYGYVNGNPVNYSDPLGLNPGVGCLFGSWGGPVGCAVGAGIGTVVMGGVALGAILSTPGDTVKTKDRAITNENRAAQRCRLIAVQGDKWPGVDKGMKRCTYACKTDSGQHNIPRFVPASQNCPNEIDWVPGAASCK